MWRCYLHKIFHPNRDPQPGEPHWREVLPLPSGGRADLSCGVVRDPTGVAVEVVVVGGAGEFERLEVDIFDLRTNEWRVGGREKNQQPFT